MRAKITCSLVMMGLLVAGPGFVSRAAAQATITSVVKQVAHRVAGGDWQESKSGTKLAAGASVRTGKRSKCEVKLGPNIIRLSERSAITLRGNQISLDDGKLYGDFKEDTIIKGGKTTATIKGTDVYIGFDADGNLVVECLSGGPVLLDLGIPGVAPVSIGAGQRVTVPQAVVQTAATATEATEEVTAAAKAVAPEQTANTPNFKNVQQGAYVSFADDVKSTQVSIGTTDMVAVLQQRVEQKAAAVEGGDETQRPAAVVTQQIQNIIVEPPPPPAGGDDENPPTGGLDVHLRQLDATRQAKKQGFLAPRLDGNTFLYKRDGNRALWGMRFTESGLYRGAFYQVAVSPQTLFQGNTSTQLTDAYAVLRSPDTYGDIIIGRQRYLKGPVQNVTTGTLITQEITDSITWSPPLKSHPGLGLDLSLIQDAYPFEVPGNQGGWRVRASSQTEKGTLGLNLMKVNAVPSPTGRNRIGATLDGALALWPEKLDVYGEFGSNIFGQNIRTFGAYFPHLYDKYDIDAYLETTGAVGASPGITVLRMYHAVSPKLTAMMTADKIAGGRGINLGVGVVAKLVK